MTTLRGKTLFITGASRGIDKAIALRAARDGAKLVIAAKTVVPHPFSVRVKTVTLVRDLRSHPIHRRSVDRSRFGAFVQGDL